jgi:beta-glucosidase/6-phospho-beta-glucosidase/beta-galactosidase
VTFAHVPDDFLWGAATAAYQIEGGGAGGWARGSIWDLGLCAYRFSRLLRLAVAG